MSPSLSPSQSSTYDPPLFIATAASTRQVYNLLSCLVSPHVARAQTYGSRVSEAQRDVFVDVYVEKEGITFVEKGLGGTSQASVNIQVREGRELRVTETMSGRTATITLYTLHLTNSFPSPVLCVPDVQNQLLPGHPLRIPHKPHGNPDHPPPPFPLLHGLDVPDDVLLSLRRRVQDSPDEGPRILLRGNFGVGSRRGEDWTRSE